MPTADKTPARFEAPLIGASLSALHCARHLQRTLTGCDAVTALVLLPLIERAAKLQADISALIDAINATE